MLQELRIDNLALIDRAELSFRGGFNAVTGETGAGKSVLLGALRMLAGQRLEKTIIRAGQTCCRVEAALYLPDFPELHVLLDELGLPPCEEEILLLTRTLEADRSPRITVNGSLTTLSNLAAVGALWIDYHGPDAGQSLFQESLQRNLLDQYARLDAEAAAYAEAWETWRSRLREREALLAEKALPPEEAEFLQGQLEKLQALDLDDDAVAELEQKFNRLSSAQELQEKAAALSEGLGGDEGTASGLGPLLHTARELADLDNAAEGLSGRLESLIVELNDLASEYGALAEEASFEEEEAAELEAQMNRWMEVRRRYGPEPAQVRAKREEIAQRLARAGDLEGALAKLEKQLSTAEKAAHAAADKLHAARAKVAGPLGEAVMARLRLLGFKKAGFSVEVHREQTLHEHGASRVRFLFTPNPGSPLLPLNKIASSGEAARVMLALKAELSAADRVPVLVFDEVDANIGGEVAGAVGRELGKLGARHQVFCITHLPQVAACAREHLVVTKDQDDEATTVTITDLTTDEGARLDELARMLGDRTAKSAREHARALLAGK